MFLVTQWQAARAISPTAKMRAKNCAAVGAKLLSCALQQHLLNACCRLMCILQDTLVPCTCMSLLTLLYCFLFPADCWSVGLCTCYTSDRQVSGCDVPACYNATQFDCADTVDELGYQTLSPCTGNRCPGEGVCSITSGAPWDNKCRPQVG
jgi:hypothetical protein